MKESVKRLNPDDEFFTSEGCYIIEVSNSTDDPDLSVARARLEPGKTTRWHRLDGTAERYVILGGRGRVEIGTMPPADVGVGDVVLIPPMCRQRITNTGTVDLVFLAICSPRYSDRVYEDVDDKPEPLQTRINSMLQTNQPAPEFSVSDQAGHTVNLSDYRNKHNVVIYFYPKDDTPGCTIEAQQFTALADRFADLGTVVLGVSKDSCESHQAFIDKYGLNVKLLADTGGELCDAYGVWQEKEKNGEKKMGIVRSTFIINRQGMLEDAIYGVNADGHARQVLDRIQQIETAG